MKKLSILIAFLSLSMMLMAQDVIVTKDARKIDCKVTEISTYVVRYQKSSNPDGPVYMIEKVDVASITYANGEVEVFGEKKNDNKQAVREDYSKQTPTENPNQVRQEQGSQENPQTPSEVKFGMDVDLIGTVGKNKNMDNAGGSIGFDFHAGLHSANRVNFIGLGIGFHWFIYNEEKEPMEGFKIRTKTTTFNIPIYLYDRISFQTASFSGLLSKNKVVPFWEIAIGGNIQARQDSETEVTGESISEKKKESITKADGGFYLRTGLGLNCEGLQFSVGYEVLTLKSIATSSAYFRLAYGF